MFPFQDYKIVETPISASNGNNLRTVYTTEYPCLMWMEIAPGQVPGFNFDNKLCFFDVTYTGNETLTARTYLFGKPYDIAEITDNPWGTQVGYCRQAGVPVLFDTRDDDYSGTIRIHVLKLPNPSVAL